ncbi:hypothetical protein C8R43DRAFT_1237874 [Mycena crocata]|nr:hypothetical protein C8R43DRAFT_1237874 [Mycena crocata]
MTSPLSRKRTLRASPELKDIAQSQSKRAKPLVPSQSFADTLEVMPDNDDPTTAVLRPALSRTLPVSLTPAHRVAHAPPMPHAHGHMAVAGGQTRSATHPGDNRVLDGHAASSVGDQEQCQT